MVDYCIMDEHPVGKCFHTKLGCRGVNSWIEYLVANKGQGLRMHELLKGYKAAKKGKVPLIGEPYNIAATAELPWSTPALKEQICSFTRSRQALGSGSAALVAVRRQYVRPGYEPPGYRKQSRSRSPPVTISSTTTESGVPRPSFPARLENGQFTRVRGSTMCTEHATGERFVKWNVLGDGNCFFHAVAIPLLFPTVSRRASDAQEISIARQLRDYARFLVTTWQLRVFTVCRVYDAVAGEAAAQGRVDTDDTLAYLRMRRPVRGSQGPIPATDFEVEDLREEVTGDAEYVSIGVGIMLALGMGLEPQVYVRMPQKKKQVLLVIGPRELEAAKGALALNEQAALMPVHLMISYHGPAMHWELLTPAPERPAREGRKKYGATSGTNR